MASSAEASGSPALGSGIDSSYNNATTRASSSSASDFLSSSDLLRSSSTTSSSSSSSSSGRPINSSTMHPNNPMRPISASSASRSYWPFAVLCAIILYLLTGTTSSNDSSLRRKNNKSSSSPAQILSTPGSITCSPMDIQVAISAAQDAVRKRSTSPVGGLPMSVAEYFALHPCVSLPGKRDPSWFTQNENIGYVVLTSTKSSSTLEAQLATWGSRVPEVWYRAYSDEANAALRTYSLPDLTGQDTYHQAQHRVLKGLQDTLITHGDANGWKQNADFVMILGDDAYVNLPELRYFTSQWNPDIPAVFGFQWVKKEGTWPGGGSGILMTRSAAKLIAEALYTECPFAGFDDMTVGFCAWRLMIPLIHSPLFDAMGDIYKYLSPPLSNTPAILSFLVIHRTGPERMYMVNDFFQAAKDSFVGEESTPGSERI